MNRRRFLFAATAPLLVALAAAMPVAAAGKPPVAPPDAGPQAVVQSLYARYAAEAYDHMTDKALRRRYFSAATATMIEKVFAKSKKLDEPGIDYEPLIDGQDGEVKDLAVTVVSADPAKAVVEAAFTSFDQKLVVGFDLVNEKGVWRIGDIRGREGASLRKIMAEFLK
jgi:hypothetical protein